MAVMTFMPAAQPPNGQVCLTMHEGRYTRMPGLCLTCQLPLLLYAARSRCKCYEDFTRESIKMMPPASRDLRAYDISSRPSSAEAGCCAHSLRKKLYHRRPSMKSTAWLNLPYFLSILAAVLQLHTSHMMIPASYPLATSWMGPRCLHLSHKSHCLLVPSLTDGPRKCSRAL